MSTADFVVVGSYSIAIAVVIAIVRFRKIHRNFHAFVFILFAAMLNEIASYLLIQVFKTGNAVSNNIFGLGEAMLWMFQFRRWNGFKAAKWTFTAVLLALTGVWIFENLVLGKISSFSSAYSIFYAFILVFLSINQVNRLIVEENRNLFTNSIFLICSGVIIFNTYRIFVESFYVFEMEHNSAFLMNVFIILAFVNLFVNLLFALATLWIPTRQRFSLPYS